MIMGKVSSNRALVMCMGLLAVALLVQAGSSWVFGRAADEARYAGGPPHYTVVMTEGHNLLVTDNAANKLYFYTTDREKPIGTPLKLRASVDLSKVGEDEIKITAHNLEKVEKEKADK
jgi:hypothetical protein